MKTCHKCKCKKDVLEFPVNRTRPDGRSETCLECKREYNRKHYKKNKAVYIAKASRYKQTVREWLWQLKSERGCGKCPERHPACLHFHHRDPGSKLFEICGSFLTRGIRQIEAEIEKCDILCANCHAKLHFDMYGHKWPVGVADYTADSESADDWFDSSTGY